MKKLVIAINSQKKSGKTSFARVYGEIISRQGLDCVSLHTAMEDSSPKSLFWDVEEDPDEEFLLAHVESNDVVVIDVASHQVEDFTNFLETSDTYEALAELDTEITVVIPNNPDVDMSADIVTIGEFFSDQADYVVLHGVTVAEDRWTGSPAQKAMNYLGAIEIDVPELNAEFATQLEHDHRIGLADALGRRKELPRFLRDELHRWEMGYATNLEQATELLIPAEKVTKSVYGSRFATSDLAD